MKKLLICIVAVTLCWCTPSLSATKKIGVSPSPRVSAVVERIEPPAAISWSDGIVDVLWKLLSINGVKNVVLSAGDNSQGKIIALNVGDLANSNELSEKIFHGYHPDLDSAVKLNEALAKAKYFIDVKGDKVHYLENDGVRGISISTSPFVIAGVPFAINVDMQFSFGQPIKHPEKTLMGRYCDVRYALPFIVKQVHIQSLSPVSANKRNEILMLVQTKFGKSRTLLRNRKIVKWKAVDRKDASLYVEMIPAGTTLSFQSDRYTREYDDDFARYNEAVENEKLIKELLEKFGPYHC